MFMCQIDGKDIYNFADFNFTQQANGTDGGLKYTFAHYHTKLKATSTELKISLLRVIDNGGEHPIKTFPDGTRTFTAIIFPTDS